MQGLPRRYKDILISRGFTDFQIEVYSAVFKIPKGQVRSYKWVAQNIGRPLAVRAVGQALKKNPLVGIVSCHRVISSDGSLGGFSKGPKQKRNMLKKEGIII